MTPADFLAAALTVAEQITDPDEREDAIHWLHEQYKQFQQTRQGEKGESSGEVANG